jgi:hypothetical protein
MAMRSLLAQHDDDSNGFGAVVNTLHTPPTVRCAPGVVNR